ncbi:MAG TPA: hypothetical protein VFC68_00920 [Treponemataceae bacterium]|nr:hypothetical protein [Treponemataceae bacterium]
MKNKRLVLSVFYMCFFFSLTCASPIDFSCGNIRITVEEYTGAVSLYRKINPEIIEDEKKQDELTKEDNTESPIIKRYTGAAGTKFGALPESSYILAKEKDTADKRIQWEPLLDTSRYTSNTAYYVLLDSGVFKLARSASMQIDASVNAKENTVRVDFTLKKIAKITVLMHVFSSKPDVPADSIHVELIMKNLKDTESFMAIKAVYDTYLGEGFKYHFSTANKDAIDSEIVFEDMSTEKWICSQNATASIRFLLHGDTITSPRSATLANKDVFLTNTWQPPAKIGRRFNSLFSYNNSALSIIWKPVYVASEKTAVLGYYITTSERGAEPAAYENVKAAMKKETVAMTGSTIESSDAFIDYEYIQKLLNRIEQLGLEPDKADPTEIEYLKREVEDIIQQLEQ